MAPASESAPPAIHARYTIPAEPTACIISAGTRKMPLPMMVPTTIAEAWRTPRSRERLGELVNFGRLSHNALIAAPRCQPAKPNLHLGIGPHQIAQLRIGIFHRPNNRLRNFARVASLRSPSLHEFGEALAALLVRRIRIERVLADHQVPLPDVGVIRARFDQHYANPERVNLDAQRLAPSFQRKLRRRVAAQHRRRSASAD